MRITLVSYPSMTLSTHLLILMQGRRDTPGDSKTVQEAPISYTTDQTGVVVGTSTEGLIVPL